MSTDDFKRFRNQIIATVLSGVIIMSIGAIVTYARQMEKVENNTIDIKDNTKGIKENSEKINSLSEKTLNKQDFEKMFNLIREDIKELREDIKLKQDK